MLFFTIIHTNKRNFKGILSSFYFIFSIESETPGLDTQIAHALGATPIKSYITK